MPPTVATPEIAATRSRLQEYAAVYSREHATTLKVLYAFPAERASYRPHERSDSALQLAWRFVMENNVALGALRGKLDLDGARFAPPPSFADVVAAYEKSARELLELLPLVAESRLDENVTFFTGPKQMGDVPVGELLWFLLLGSVHHRGQMSVYVRCNDGKVPSIYGPSADEPWS